MYKISYTSKFKKDVKRCDKRNWEMSLLNDAIRLLGNTGNLPAQYKTHSLSGNYDSILDSHIDPDWLLLWQKLQSDDEKFEGEIILIRTGTHSDLF